MSFSKIKRRTNTNFERRSRTNSKPFVFFFFSWYIRFYGKHVSRKQANTKTCCKWFSATRVTSSCGWVIQCLSCLNTECKGEFWLAHKTMCYIPRSSACSRVLGWNQSINCWSSQTPPDVNGNLEVMQNRTLSEDYRQLQIEQTDIRMPNSRQKNARPKKGIGCCCTAFIHNTTGWGRSFLTISLIFLSNSFLWAGTPWESRVEYFQQMFVCENTLLCWSVSAEVTKKLLMRALQGPQPLCHNEHTHRNIMGHFYLK